MSVLEEEHLGLWQVLDFAEHGLLEEFEERRTLWLEEHGRRVKIQPS